MKLVAEEPPGSMLSSEEGAEDRSRRSAPTVPVSPRSPEDLPSYEVFGRPKTARPRLNRLSAGSDLSPSLGGDVEYIRFIRTGYRQEKKFGPCRVLRWHSERARP